jgi:hypothetical protein
MARKQPLQLLQEFGWPGALGRRFARTRMTDPRSGIALQ